jgi:hypothetical protein
VVVLNHCLGFVFDGHVIFCSAYAHAIFCKAIYAKINMLQRIFCVSRIYMYISGSCIWAIMMNVGGITHLTLNSTIS